MFGYILLGIGLIGTGIAAYHDIKTTDVPDYPAIYMAIAAILVHGAHSFATGNYSFLMQSLLYGGILSAVGAAQYLVRMWGGADMLLLGTFGFLFPYLPQEFAPLAASPPWPFPLTLFLNLLLIGSIYSLLYAIVLFFKPPSHINAFLHTVRSHQQSMVLLTGIYAILVLAALIISPLTLAAFFPLALQLYAYILALYILYLFLSTIQNHSMEETVPAERLQEGDVLAEDVHLQDTTMHARRIEGLTAKQINSIRAEKDTVEIMHGVPYIPVFLLTLLVSLFVGDIIYILLPL